MDKPSITSIKNAGANVALSVSEIIYVPRQAQRELKARYWEAWKEDPTVEAHLVTPAAIIEETGDGRITKWWSKVGFKDWFLNQETFLYKTIANGERGLEIIQELMEDENLNPALRLKAAQISVDSLVKLRERTAVEKFADAELNKLSADELDDRIKRLETK